MNIGRPMPMEMVSPRGDLAEGQPAGPVIEDRHIRERPADIRRQTKIGAAPSRGCTSFHIGEPIMRA
jgi:hypothetical protein